MTFDLKTYQRHAGKLDLDGIDFDAFRDLRLSAPALRVLQYMHDVEFHTACYLRNLLNTRAHHDPELTGFMTIWNYEELWHGEAIAQVLDRHELPSGPVRVAASRRRLGWKLDTSPIGWMAFSAAVPRFLAVHMTIGAVNEWTTQAGYSRLAAVADHPVLTELLRRIMRQEGRHIDVYASRAKEELAGAGRAAGDASGPQDGVAAGRRRGHAPLGGGLHGPDPVRRPRRHQAVERIDSRIHRLPGMDGLDLMATTLDKHLRRPDAAARSRPRPPPVAA